MVRAKKPLTLLKEKKARLEALIKADKGVDKSWLPHLRSMLKVVKAQIKEIK